MPAGPGDGPGGRAGPDPAVNAFPPPGDWWRHDAETVWLPTAEEMAELDRRAVRSGAIPERALIESAGREIAHLVQEGWPAGPIVALAGSGHNGADALAALRCLRAWGRETRAVRCGGAPPEPDVLAGWEQPLADPEALEGELAGAAVVLDGILGTGVRGAPREPQASLIRRAVASGVPIVAVDGPSGADPTTGAVPGACVRARLTICLGWPKLGLIRFPARRYCGDLVAVEIGFPPPDPIPGARAITAAWVRRLLPARAGDAHKGDAGYLTVVAGQSGMAGAAVLAARAAVRGGAGIVRVVGDPANRTILQSTVPEAVFVDWDDADAVEASVEWADAIALGPGLGRTASRRELVERVLVLRGERPAVLDADALSLWAGQPDALAERLARSDLLTPHPGELARLLDASPNEVADDAPARVREVARRFGCAVLLKGAPSLLAVEGEALRVAGWADAALATGGVGDVLTGLAGAYAAAGAEPADAGAAALLVSRLAAAGAPEAVGHSALDLAERLPAARRAVREARGGGWPAVLFASPSPRGR